MKSKLTALTLFFLVIINISAMSWKPSDMVSHEDRIFVAGRVSGVVYELSSSLDSSKVFVQLPGPVSEMIVSEKYLFAVGGEGQGKVYRISLIDGTFLEADCGHSPLGLSLSGSKLIVCDRFGKQLLFVNTETLSTDMQIPTVREPVASVVSGSDQVAVVGHMPEGSGIDPDISSNVALHSLSTGELIKKITLPAGSSAARNAIVTPDGKWMITAHILSRFQVPTTQIDRGWINTNAISIVNLEAGEFYATVLLDSVDYGAANPWDLLYSEEDSKLFVSLAGTNEVIVVRFDEMLKKLSKESNRKLVSNRLSYLSPISKRAKLKGKAPRSLVKINDRLFAMNYFTESVEQLALRDLKLIPVNMIMPESGSTNEEDLPDMAALPPASRGEYLFNTADICFQKWQSCASCHPDARSDGLNWDLLNDGIGNPKQSKSMLKSHETPPAMITGIRAKAEVAVRAGLRHILFLQRPEEEAVAIDEYLKSLKPVPSPYLKNGKLSQKQKEGAVLAEKAGCLVCHSGSLYTDGNKYQFDLGSDRDKDRPFDTPSLVELWRTAPYMYDGRHETLTDMLNESRSSGRHGSMKDFTDEQIDSLASWLLTL